MTQSRHNLKTITPRSTLFVAALTLCILQTAQAQDGGEENFVVIKAGRIITIADADLTQGEIVLVNGKIRLVGKSLDYPASAKIINAGRLYVMPGMIHPRTRWGLPSYSRSGAHGDSSAAKEVYIDQIDFEPLVKSGFTTVCFYPNGTGITGAAAVYRTAGDTGSRSLGSSYQRITMSSPGRDKKTLRDAISKAKKEIEKVEKAKKDWDEKQKKAKEEADKKAKEEAAKNNADQKKDKSGDNGEEKKEPEKKEPEKKDDAKNGKKEPAKKEVFTPPKIDPTVLPIVEWFRDKKGSPFLFELSRASDLIHLDDALATEDKLPKNLVYFSSTYSPDYHHVVSQLGERKAAVVLPATIDTLPNTVTRYNLAAELANAGCDITIVPRTDSILQTNGFRYQMAELVRSGLSREAALKAVTLHPAKALGLADRLGTIEKGKDADLIFLDGDPLNPHTRVVRVMIAGEIVWEAPQ